MQSRSYSSVQYHDHLAVVKPSSSVVKKTIRTAMIMFPTAIAGRACLHESPTANIELAICQVAAFAASEIQYAT